MKVSFFNFHAAISREEAHIQNYSESSKLWPSTENFNLMLLKKILITFSDWLLLWIVGKIVWNNVKTTVTDICLNETENGSCITFFVCISFKNFSNSIYLFDLNFYIMKNYKGWLEVVSFSLDNFNWFFTIFNFFNLKNASVIDFSTCTLESSWSKKAHRSRSTN